jgi:hypothetical protein
MMRQYWFWRYLRDLLILAVFAGIFSLAYILLSLAVHGRVNW